MDSTEIEIVVKNEAELSLVSEVEEKARPRSHFSLIEVKCS